MLKVIALMGCPGSGKSTLMRKVIDELGEGHLEHIKSLYYHLYPKSKTIVLGRYDKDQVFPGTDRLSMSVQPIALKVLTSWTVQEDKKNWRVLFEGDRLCNQSFLSVLKELPLKLKMFCLAASDEILNFRYRERESTQNEAWLKGRMTKTINLLEAFGDEVIVLDNENKTDLILNQKRILRSISDRKDQRA